MNHILDFEFTTPSAEALAQSARNSMTTSLKQSETPSENNQLSYPGESASSKEHVSDNKMAHINSRHDPFSPIYETNNTMATITSLDAPLSSTWPSTTSSEDAITSSTEPSEAYSNKPLSHPWSLASSQECEHNYDMSPMTSLDAPLSPAWPSTLSSEDFPPPSPKPKRTFPPRQIPWPWSLARSEEHRIIKANDHFPFLKLPMELRHIIYKLHLSKGGDFNAIPMFCHRRPVIGVNLLATCKQIYVEAVQYVYLGRTWNVGEEWMDPDMPLGSFPLFDDSFYFGDMSDRALARIEKLRISIPVPSRCLTVAVKALRMHKLEKMEGLRSLDVAFQLCGCAPTRIHGSYFAGSLLWELFTIGEDRCIEIARTSMPANRRKELQRNVKYVHSHETQFLASHCKVFAPR
ncbi:hypothetical protein D6C98_00663 [Aureobasidium pullulans]|uniref:Uncharacterized protein n=1 Tax=Aureobasidium pullulans TaxID=5580 RepID=A0A4S8WJB6_AURPU|nr:hypothetical protein D6D23_04489 [Aureobasidium pullulans]THW58393.1 hypothetical protein D6D20_07259 [Aureobasidium pullulans]THX95563.1 hypothetical protein D6D03_09172 [Aureobasidium pullulans]THY64568.1 hypothetical protein D6C98_00663 [Aureobasidium pullulans]THZ92689.1 hypothetical protein D6C82_09282 [Aureobasidium pullulans]